MKCAVCGNERTIVFTRKGIGIKTEYTDFKAGNCSYCSWKGDEGPGKELRDMLVKSKLENKNPGMSKDEFRQHVLDNFESNYSDVTDAINKEIHYCSHIKKCLSSNPEEEAVQLCYYWTQLERMEILPEHLFKYRVSALYFQGLRKKE